MIVIINWNFTNDGRLLLNWNNPFNKENFKATYSVYVTTEEKDYQKMGSVCYLTNMKFLNNTIVREGPKGEYSTVLSDIEADKK